MGKNSDGLLGGLITFAHKSLGLSPNQISTIGFLTGLAAAAAVLLGQLLPGLILLAFSQIIDGLDGGVARKYGLESEHGKLLELIFDRSVELAMFLALAAAGYASFRMAFLAFVAIMLVSMIEPLSKFDPGFKRFMLYFGYLAALLFHVRGFEIAMQVIFFANLAGFVVGTILVDFRLQKEIDGEAMIRREQELDAGIPQPPPDAPSFLSKLFS